MTEATMTPSKTDTSTKNAEPTSFDNFSYEEMEASMNDDGTMETTDRRYRLVIDDGVVEKIASRGANEIDGVLDMKGNVLSMIQEGLGGSDRSKGVDADVIDEDNATVELSVIMEYGKSAPEVFDEIKRVVEDDINKMTGLNVAELVVNVVDVMTKDEFDQKRNNSIMGSGAEGNAKETKE